MTPAARARSPRSQEPSSYVALLRGINVGGKHRLAMADLAARFAEAGCAHVRTYIQSGNVVFCAGSKVAQRVSRMVEDGLAAAHGLSVPVVVRTAEELRAIADSNPFLESGADPASLHVAFLADAPTQDRIAALDPGRSPGDSFNVRGREVYLCLPNGMARTRLTNAYLDRALATTSTLRNWRTVLKLAEMTGGPLARRSVD